MDFDYSLSLYHCLLTKVKYKDQLQPVQTSIKFNVLTAKDQIYKGFQVLNEEGEKLFSEMFNYLL